MAKDKDQARDEDDDRDEDERDETEAPSDEDGEETRAASSKDDDETDEDEAERDASTAGVAKALGVDEEEEEASTEGQDGGEKPAAAPNRAARRREEVLKKRRARNEKARAKSEDEAEGEGEAEEEEGEEPEAVAAKAPLPKDKNLRAKELLKRRQEAAKKAATPLVGLSAGEMVQDSLARAGSGATKWLRTNFRAVAAVLVLGVVGTAGTMYYLDHREQKAGKTTDTIAKAMLTEQAPVIPEDKRPDEQKALDPMPVFASTEAKADAVLAAYTKVVDEHPGTGPGILGKLGQAGAYLDKNMPDQAFSAYEDVLRSELAKADVDVRARATEGKGFALEAKKDFDGAMNVFQQLEGIDKVYADLGKYHQARMFLAKGEKDKGKEILVALNKALEVPTLEGPQSPHLRAMIEETLRGIDPSLVKPKRDAGGPKGQMSPEELERIKKQIEEMQRKQAEEGEHGDGH